MDRIFLSLLIGFGVSLFLSPLVIRLIKKLKANQTIYEYVDMHRQKANTPTMGGIIFLLGSIVGAVCCFSGSFNLGLVCLVCFVAFGIIGFLDDFLKIKLKRNLGLKAYQKIIGQVAISVIIAIFAYKNANIGSTIYLPFSTQTIDLGWFYIPFCVFVFLAITNSVNLTDGLDGLAGGVSVGYLFGFTFINFILLKTLPIFDSAVLVEQQNLLVICGSVMGALLAYMLFNSFPAKIFMGDTGSLALGGLIASLAVFSKQILLIPILGIMFVVSCVSVVIQVAVYKLKKKRVFLMAPYHHHLEKKGIHESKIVVIYIVITIIISVASILATTLINM